MKYFLEFAIDDKKFAVPIDEIIEIARPKAIQQQSEKKKNIIGSINLRHDNIFIIDLASVLKVKGGKRYEIMIADIGGQRIGFCVDRVFGIIEHDKVKPVPEMIRSHRSLTGMIMTKDTIIPVLSLEKAITKANLSTIKNNARSKNK
ncbi:hypothetical protein A2Y85_04030 [candidate division WOR-3 bacterium RBG_13_43_14]|uniref:CheW-like domain-containing protein n=1 Tax=candidate division WOR-3 bacterium RBG_13_43_14 TaxID=1802590 RepID=A0A1F4U9P3_UNCW3|nr:MAG: hypothetical protein A2Y85_04030 [candidate division WOR-3 bacterium RBG_13_43_14]